MTRLQERYQKEVIPAMIEKFGYKNIMEVPKLEKIVINMGVGEAKENQKVLESAISDLTLIAGQKPILTRAKKSVANFKIRENMPLGCKVTLRRRKMYEFMDRLINIALPRIRDFRGVPVNSFDKSGNYTLGITEQVIFPEIEPDRLPRTQGMDIVFVVKNARTIEESKFLLELFGMPFSKKEGKQ